MKEQGVQTSIHYPPIHHFKAYSGKEKKSFLPATEMMASRELTLPLYPTMSDSDLKLVIQAVQNSLRIQ